MKASYLVVLLVAFLLIGCAPEAPPAEEEAAPAEPSAPAEEAAAEEAAAASSATVDITNAAFDPVEVTIGVGGSVTWTNADTRKHVIAGPRRLFSETVEAGDTFSFTFEEAGEYKITDVIAPMFFGTVIVE